MVEAAPGVEKEEREWVAVVVVWVKAEDNFKDSETDLMNKIGISIAYLQWHAEVLRVPGELGVSLLSFW